MSLQPQRQILVIFPILTMKLSHLPERLECTEIWVSQLHTHA